MKKLNPGDLVRFTKKAVNPANTMFNPTLQGYEDYMKACDMEGKLGILVENVSTSKKKPNSRWRVYIQESATMWIFTLQDFVKVSGIYPEYYEEKKMDDNSIDGDC